MSICVYLSCVSIIKVTCLSFRVYRVYLLIPRVYFLMVFVSILRQSCLFSCLSCLSCLFSRFFEFCKVATSLPGKIDRADPCLCVSICSQIQDFHVYRVYRVYFQGVLILICIRIPKTLKICVLMNQYFPRPFVSIRVYRVYLRCCSCLSCLSSRFFDPNSGIPFISGRVYRVYHVYPCLSCLSWPFFMSIVSIYGSCLFFRVYRVYFRCLLMTFVSIRVYSFYFLQIVSIFPCLSYLSMQSG